MTTGLRNHWTDNKAWTSLQVHQKYATGEKAGQFYTEGPNGEKTTAKFSALKHEESGALFQQNSNWETLMKVQVAALTFIPHVIATAIGNTRLVQMGIAAYQEGFGNIGAHLPSKQNLWALVRNSAFLGGVYLVHRNDLLLGATFSSIFNVIKMGAIFSASLYTAYNPRGAAIWINTTEDVIHQKPLAECQSLASNHWLSTANWKELLEGSIPLTSILNMHRVGNIKDKVNDQPRFPQVEIEAKKDK